MKKFAIFLLFAIIATTFISCESQNQCKKYAKKQRKKKRAELVVPEINKESKNSHYYLIG